VIGAYITDVEKAEEQSLAASDARAQEQAAEEPAPAAAAAAGDLVQAASAPDDMFRATEGRWGSREAEITRVTLIGEDGAAGHVFQAGERITIQLAVRARQRLTDFVFGIGIFNADGVCCYGTNTEIAELKPVELSGDGQVDFIIENLDLVEGTYKLDVAVHRRDGYPYDYHRLLNTFRVKSRSKDVGVYRPRHRWEFSATVRLVPYV
jgi:hypothetical protein